MSLGLLLLRLSLGLVFARYGLQKLAGWFEGPGRVATARQLWPGAGMAGRSGAAALGLLEVAGAGLAALGLGSWFGALFLSAALLVLVLAGAEDRRPWAPGTGYDYHLVALAAAFVLAGVGPGRWSLDEAIDFDWFGTGWALLQLGIAWVAAVTVTFLVRPRS